MLGAIASLFGTVANNNANRNIAEEDRRFQQQENEKARQHNLMLAKYQNAENVAQWRRESNFNEQMMDKQNAYSSPAAQMSRYAAAGLNPNLIYGQSNVSAGINGSSAAGSMTGGASSPVADAAATSERHGRQSYSTALGEVGKGLMNLPLYREEVRKMQLENDEKQFELGFQEFIHKNKYDPLGITDALKGSLTPAQRKYLQGLRNDIAQGDSILADVDAKQLENAFNSKVFNDQVEKISSESKISKENADYLAKSAVYRLNADKFQSELRELEMLYQQNKNKWMDWDRWIGHGINAAHAVGDIFALKNLLSIFGVGKGKGVLESGGKGYWKKTGENTLEWTGN